MVSHLFPSSVYICAHDRNEHITSFFIRNKGDRALENKTFKQVTVRIFSDFVDGKQSLCGKQHICKNNLRII